jgi:hypothetical protein
MFGTKVLEKSEAYFMSTRLFFFTALFRDKQKGPNMPKLLHYPFSDLLTNVMKLF